MKWNRGVCQLGDTDEERYIVEQLGQRWPASAYPVHINIVGAQDTTAIGVQVWNAKDKIIEKAYPEQYDPAPHPMALAVMAKVGEIINRLKGQQKL